MAESFSNLPVDIGDYNSFPELCGVQTTVSELDRKSTLYASKDLQIDAKVTKIESRVTQFETCKNKFEQTMEPFVVRKILITAREILKRAMGEKSKKHGYGRQEYHKTSEVKRRVMVHPISFLFEFC